MKKKTCGTCGEEMPLDAFHKSKNRKDGHDYWCKRCRKLYQKACRDTDLYKQYRREYKLINKYGITELEREQMVRAQGHKCKLCGISFVKVRGNVDHCHKTGRVRGIVCRECNTGLGHVERMFDLGITHKAIEYLWTGGEV